MINYLLKTIPWLFIQLEQCRLPYSQVLQRMAFHELTNLATAQSMAKRLEDENSLSPPKTPLTWSLNAKT